MSEQTIQTETPRPKVNDFCVPRNFAKSAVYPLWQSNSRTSIVFTNEQISNLLKEPYKSHKKLRDVSNSLYTTCPQYSLIVDYFATILAFDYVVFPDNVSVKEKTLKKRFMDATKKVRDANIREIKTVMLTRMIVNGSVFWYDLSDNQNTIFVEIDSRLCRMAMIDSDNLWRYFIDLSLLTKDKLYEYPLEIQDAYEKWLDVGRLKSNVLTEIEGQSVTLPANLYLVSAKGFCMNAHMEKVENDYPLFAPMFKDFNVHEDNKTYLNETLKAEAIKLIHLKIPVDKEDGTPLLDKDTIDAYHESAKEHLPANVAPLTNPFEVNAIALDKSQQNQTNLVEHSSKVIATDSGISETIFSAETTNGLAYSTAKDVAKILPYLYYFSSLINYKIKDLKMKVRFLPIGFKDRMDFHKHYAADLPLGGSRLLWLATNGLELYDTFNVLEFENEIDIDSLLPVKMSSSQMSGDAEGGRPKLDDGEKADETVKGEKNQ